MSFDFDYDEQALPDRFHAVYKCYSAAFLNDRERSCIENGGKILLPQSALEQLIDQVDQFGIL
jgi:ubiquitin fusion degradation protein 1